MRSRAGRRLVVVIATAALVSACAAGQASLAPSAPETPRTTPSATPSPPATHSDAPSAVPTQSTPTLPEAGDVVLTISHDYVGDAWSTTSLVADGRLTSPSDTGWQVRVLAPEGVERVRAEVLATGLFSENLVIPTEVVLGAGPECAAGDGMASSSA
jgi:hypothetical protein